MYSTEALHQKQNVLDIAVTLTNHGDRLLSWRECTFTLGIVR